MATSTDTGPHACSTAAVTVSGAVGSSMSAGSTSDSVGQQRGGRAQLVLAARGQRDPVALGREPDRHRAADAAAGAGDQGHPAVVGLGRGRRHPRSMVPAMTKWEYATVPLLVHATKQILDTWGEDGWELVQVVPGPGGGDQVVAYLKRAEAEHPRASGWPSSA